MKANEAPEKIYLIRNILTPTSLNTTNDCRDKYLPEWYEEREKDIDVEYTRTDAFIEKACDYIRTLNFKKYFDGLGEILVFFRRDEFVEDFRQAMKGE